MRKTQRITIGPEGKRDAGKVFVVTEMSAAAAEKWGRRAFQALAKSGLDVPEDVASAGLSALAAFGFRAISSAPSDEVDWLMAQLMDCVVFLPDPTKPEISRGAHGTAGQMFADDIEEYTTRIRLQMEAFETSLGFSMAAFRKIFQPSAEPVTQAA